MARTLIVLYARQPVSGAVKRRLARMIGPTAAAAWYRRNLAKTFATLAKSGLPHIVALDRCSQDRLLKTAAVSAVVRQVSGDLGRRMAASARSAGAATVIVGSDIPELNANHLRWARDAVSRFDLVLGPANDGGYYLVGVKSPAHVFRLYDGVRWSTSHALADTLRNVPRHWRVGFLPRLNDVDRADDLKTTTNAYHQPRAIAAVSRRPEHSS